MNHAPAPDVVERVRGKSHAFGIHLRHGARNAEQPEQLRMGPVPDPDLEHVLGAELVEWNDRVERYLSPRHESPRRSEETTVDLLEIGFAARALGERFPPVVAHRRE